MNYILLSLFGMLGGGGNINPWELTPGGYQDGGGVAGYMYGGGVMYCISIVGEYIGSGDGKMRSGTSVLVYIIGVAGGTENTGKWGLVGATGVLVCWLSPSE